jgi:hypothetical protein
MRVVPARFAVEVHGGIAGIIGGRRGPLILAAEALETGPGFQQRPVHGELFIREQTRRAGLRENRVKERAGDVISLSNSRSRFLLKVVGDQMGSSILRPTNHRYSTL